MDDKLLKVSEAAQWLDLSEYQVLTYCREGILPHARLGRAIRLSRAALEEFIATGGRGYKGGWKKEA